MTSRTTGTGAALAGAALAVGIVVWAGTGEGAERAVLAAPVDRDFYDDGQADPAKVELGRLLFFDKLLSGNKNIACATCHHPVASSGDALSLPVGEGGVGLGADRYPGPGAVARVPRNAPALFNLGAREFSAMFHDGRVAADPDQPSGFSTPAGDALPQGLDNVLAAQAMFPVTSATEMAGQGGENAIGDVAETAGPAAVWDYLAKRLRGVPAYATRFVAVFDDIRSPADVTFVHAANAIAAFEATAFRADRSPFDDFLRRGAAALEPAARRGMDLFYGEAGCGTCHGGPFQTDQQFHAIAMPQIGPGKGDGDGHEDYGRERVSGDPEDRYRFRTPSLRNVALTGPWGHGGAYATLEAVVRHHLDPVNALNGYDRGQAVLPPRADLDAQDMRIQASLEVRQAIAGANSLTPTAFSDGEVADLIAFLHALTDPASRDLNHLVPDRVPSGLPVAD